MRRQCILCGTHSPYMYVVNTNNPEDLKVHLERQDNLEVLEVKIELPEAAR